jgi:uncharacterized Zn finger protein
MQTLPKPTEADVEALATGRTLDRAEDYLHSGQVQGLIWRGDTLSASVWGSSDEPYTVTVSFAGDRSLAANAPVPTISTANASM